MLSKISLLSHLCLFFPTIEISAHHETASILGHPFLSFILILSIAGVALLLLRDRIPHWLAAFFPTPDSSYIPLKDVYVLESLDVSDGSSLRAANDTVPSPRLRSKRTLNLLLAIAICLRIELFRKSLSDRQCKVPSVEGYVPFLIAAHETWRNRHASTKADHDLDKVSSSSRGSLILPALCLSIANALQSSVLAGPRSTYICPLSSSSRTAIPVSQLLAVLLDCLILIITRAAVRRLGKDSASGNRGVFTFTGITCLISSIVLLLRGAVALATGSVYWIEITDIGWPFFGSVVWYSTILVLSIPGIFYITFHHGALHLAMFVVTLRTYLAGLSYAWSDRNLLSSPSRTGILAYLMVFFVGIATYLYTNQGSSHDLRKPSFIRQPVFKYAILALLVILLGVQTISPAAIVPSHPIDVLMTEASEQANVWLDQASQSKRLSESVEHYRRRYHRYPPPGFDAWYTYATAKSSIVIDDYDTMMDDLKPFWGLTPAQIRQRTQEVMSDTWNEVSEVMIRNGCAKLGPNFLPTHRWMLDGVCDMINEFSQFIPDMDVLFNLNDEPRVAIPFQDMQKLLDVPTLKIVPEHRWSSDRAKQWETPEDSQSLRPFEDHSRTNALDEGTIACPPKSYAQKAHIWDSSPLCTACAGPHSSGAFLSNWTLSASPCHQPDLRHLHGFYLSPAAFKPSHKLLPIFSQSKVVGYSDILFPSPWNYMDKVKYDPSPDHPDSPFAEKENTLFWRGATSEGVSRGGTWKGMTRQRLVHLANNLTTDSRGPTLPILLPHPTQQGKFTYQHFPTNPITALNLSLDIAIVNGIARAWDNDGAAQDAEFHFAPPTDFQDHWRYRYLFDMDGAGFSGRFLPFLQSHSLPFRAGIFRSWWDSRLTAWRHFVPIDVRLHGLLSTLVYFTGTPGFDATGEAHGGSREGEMKARIEKGEEIAEAGREWAAKVLRKEDMQVYMFRLLLEWGRLTDDARDEIGFTG